MVFADRKERNVYQSIFDYQDNFPNCMRNAVIIKYIKYIKYINKIKCDKLKIYIENKRFSYFFDPICIFI